MSDALLVEDRGGVRTLTLNRPDKFIAMNVELLEGLPAELERAADDPAVRVVVLTGRGRAFCAGGDLEMMNEGVGTLDVELPRMRVAALLREMPKPTVAAINGVASGGGLSIALAADLRIATASARFSAAYAAVALCGDYGVTFTLPRLVGPEQARRLLFLGETWDAPTALARGLVGQVVADDAFPAEVSALADRLAATAPLGIARMKANLVAAEAADFAAVLAREAQGMLDLIATADFAEGVAAFQERRPPRFEGH